MKTFKHFISILLFECISCGLVLFIINWFSPHFEGVWHYIYYSASAIVLSSLFRVFTIRNYMIAVIIITIMNFGVSIPYIYEISQIDMIMIPFLGIAICIGNEYIQSKLHKVRIGKFLLWGMVFFLFYGLSESILVFVFHVNENFLSGIFIGLILGFGIGIGIELYDLIFKDENKKIDRYLKSIIVSSLAFIPFMVILTVINRNNEQKLFLIPIQNNQYHRLMENKLLDDIQGDVILKMIVIPSFSTGYAVTLNRHESEYYLCYSECISINNSVDSLRINISKMKIDSKFAEEIISTWSLLPENINNKNDMLGLDGCTTIFGIKNNSMIEYQTWCPPKGTIAHRLEQTGQLLKKYIDVDDRQKNNVINDIRKTLKLLRKRLKPYNHHVESTL